MSREVDSYGSTVLNSVAQTGNKCTHCVNGYITVYDSNDDKEWQEPCSRCNPKAYYEWVRG